MKKPVKIILLSIVLLAAAAGAVYTLTAPLAVPLTYVSAGTAELTFREKGTVAAGGVVQIYPMAQGKILEVPVEEGQRVAAGDVLCVLDAEPLRLKASQVQSAIQGYRAQMSAAAEQTRSGNLALEENLRLQDILIEQCGAVLAKAEADLSRVQLLYDEGILSLAELEAAKAGNEQASSALDAAVQQRAVIAAGQDTGSSADYYRALIQAEEAGLAQLERDIAGCVVTATAEGTVTGLPAKETNYASGAAPLAEITIRGNGTVETFVSTKDIGGVKEGDAVTLTLERREGDLVFPGTVSHVDDVAEIRLSALGVEERRVRVEILPDYGRADGAFLGVGYSVDVAFVVYRGENKLTVPKTALFKDGGRDMLWVVRDGKAQAVEVTKGMELRTETVIEEGLSDGDAVISTANNDQLKDGRRVKNEAQA